MSGAEGEVFQTPLLMSLFLGREDADIEWNPVSEQMPDDPGQLVCHGGNSLGGSEFGAQAPVLVSQNAFVVM